MLEWLSPWLTVSGIGLEILGFMFFIRSTKELIWTMRPGFIPSGFYADPDTGKAPDKIAGTPKVKQYKTSIIAVIIGLSLQVIAASFQFLPPS